MIQVTPQMRILVAVEPADFRKGNIEDLPKVALVANEAYKYIKLKSTNSDDKTNAKRRDAHPSAPPKIDVNVFELMTESEVIQFLRIPEISISKNYHNVIEHLKKFRGLPRIHICRKAYRFPAQGRKQF